MIEKVKEYYKNYDVLAMEKPRFDIMYDDRYVGPTKDWV